MAAQTEWQRVAEALGAVVVDLLEEFDDMMRSSEHADRARAALAHLHRLGGYRRQGDSSPGRSTPGRIPDGARGSPRSAVTRNAHTVGAETGLR